ncbi:MAG: CYTH domain-containing protein, partial [Gammaproteobacteria bacterium]|nr:CYTH domain-containing protein [Gammaproteobacteria bacterium]
NNTPMATEIERKFLLNSDAWRAEADAGVRMRQGYLIGAAKASVRVRLSGDKAYLNIKSATLGVQRQEYEYAIPVQDANDLLDTLCEQPLIEKIRYHVRHGDHLWEIDVFEGDNQGLIVAEVELDDENEAISLPSWVDEEVSHDPRYYNVSLVKHPYRNW